MRSFCPNTSLAFVGVVSPYFIGKPPNFVVPVHSLLRIFNAFLYYPRSPLPADCDYSSLLSPSPSYP